MTTFVKRNLWNDMEKNEYQVTTHLISKIEIKVPRESILKDTFIQNAKYEQT